MSITRAIIGFLLSFVFLAFFVSAISGVQMVFNHFDKPIASVMLGSVVDSQLKNLDNSNNVDCPEPEFEASSVISVNSDLVRENRVVYVKDVALQLPIASLTKLMTAIVVLDNYDLSSLLVIDEAADAQAPMRQDVKLGDTITVESLLDIMIVSSSNKSAYALSEVMGTDNFVDTMNRKAKEIGLKNTIYYDPTGLSPKNVSTVADIAKLAEYILAKYPRISSVSRAKEYFVPGFGRVVNTDQLLSEFPDAVCSKTGFTDEAKGCLLLVVKNPNDNNYLINVVLGAEDRFTEMRKLINWSSGDCK